MNALIVLLIYAAPESDYAITQHVERIEFNTRYVGEFGSPLKQIIFWTTYPDGRQHVVDYRIIIDARPILDRRTGKWTMRWRDKGHIHDWIKEETLREVTADFYHESHTWHDPEAMDRAELKMGDRYGLRPRRGMDTWDKPHWMECFPW